MAVYGQEYKAIDFSKGLWLTDDADNVPEGYCAQLTNFYINETGEASLRPNYCPIYTQGTTNVLKSDITNTTWTASPPEYDFDRFHKAFSSNAVAFNDPILVSTSQTTAPDGIVRWIRRSGFAGVSVTMDVSAMPRELAQYRDRYYALNIAGLNISRWTFNASTITIGSLQTFTEELNSLVVFRDRLFASGINRLYFTDLPTSGGYPENWNSANNFISMPALGATIVNMLVHNDRIFIFTTEGVYQLYALGEPTSWTLTLISPNVRVQRKNAVALVENTFVYCDLNQVYLFNGTSTKEIGDPIRYALSFDTYRIRTGNSGYSEQNAPSAVRIIPYQEGFIMATASSDFYDEEWVNNGTPRYFYFDGSWSEIQFNGATISGVEAHVSLINVIKNKKAYMPISAGERETDIIVELRANRLDGSNIPDRFDIIFYSVRNSNTQSLTAPTFTATLITRQVNIQTAPNILARLFEPIVTLKNSLRVLSANLRTDSDIATTSPSVSTGATASPIFSFTDVIRIPTTIERTATIEVALEVLFTNATYSQVEESFPSAKIKSILYKTNTDTRQIPDQAYRT